MKQVQVYRAMAVDGKLNLDSIITDLKEILGEHNAPGLEVAVSRSLTKGEQAVYNLLYGAEV